MRAAIAIFILASIISPVRSSEAFDAFRSLSRGYAALCRQSEVDELQVIGAPRTLTKQEVHEVTSIFAAEDTWYQRMPDGTLRSAVTFCTPYYDVKFHLIGEDGSAISLRLCTSCRQVAAFSRGSQLELPIIRDQAFQKLRKFLDAWFPGWEKTTAANRSAWHKAKPNKAPEPTP